MVIRYEINPPKLQKNSSLEINDIKNSLEKLQQRVFELSADCGSIHITDSVLGVPRISPITCASLIKKDRKSIDITSSVRVRDRNLISLTQTIYDMILADITGALILKGDEPPEGPKDSKLIPSQVVKELNEIGLGEKIDLFLSISNKPNFNKIQKKIDAEPIGFFTQVIHSIEEVTEISDKLKSQGFKIIPCVILPSEKNFASAQFLKLDWSNYEENVLDFIKNIHEITGQILISSTNDFKTAREVLSNISKLA